MTSQSPWKECCEQLRSSSAPLTLKARIVVEFLRCLLDSECPPLLQTGLIQAVFSAVQRNDLLAEIQRRIRQEFRFDERALRNLDVELGYYLDHNVIA